MAEIAPLPFVRGADPSNIPERYLRRMPGETTELLVNEQGQPLHRLIPVERSQLDWQKVQQLPEAVYNEHFGTFHPRSSTGELTTTPSTTSYLTVPPHLSEEEGINFLKQRLTQYGLHKQLATEWPVTQDVLDFAFPTGGAAAGGMLGGAVAGPVGALAGSVLGGAIGGAESSFFRPQLTPSRVDTAPPFQSEMAYGALQGAVGEGLNQVMNLARLGVRTLGMRTLIRDLDLNPEQAALFARGGPFYQANVLTGEQFYPRLSNYALGPIGDLDKYVSNALLARYASLRQAQGLNRNLGALLTDYVTQLEASGENLPFGERLMSWLGRVDKDGRFTPGTLEHGARTVQRAMYDAADTIVESHGGGVTLNTQPLIDLLGQRGMAQGERSPVAAAVDAKISNQLSDMERRTVTRTQGATETATGQGVTISGTETQATRATPRTATSTEGSAERLTEELPIGSEQILGTGGGAPPMPAGTNVFTRTEQAAQSQTVRTDLPLEGWLHTLDVASGDHVPEVTLGRGMQLRRAVNRALIEERKLGSNADPEHLRLMRQFEQVLDGLLNPALDSVDPNLATMYRDADRFTAQMYQDLRNETIMRQVVNVVGRNPEEFRSLATSPHNVQIIDAIRDAFYMSRHVPAGSGLPASLSFAPTFFDNMVMPEIRFQAIKSTLPLAQHDLLARLVGSHTAVQDLVDQGRVLLPQPGAFLQLRERLGDATYNRIMGGAHTGDMFIALDQALSDAARSSKESQKIAVMILQFGGISGMMTGAELTRRGQTREGLIGMAAGGAVLFTPGMINRMLTDPNTFERVILGIRTGMQDSGTMRLLSNIAAGATRELYRPAVNAPARDVR